LTAELSRRLLLRAALAAGGVGLAAPLLAACSSARPRPPGALPAQTQAAPVASPRPNAAVAGERHLLAAYTAVLAHHPGLSDVLALPLAHHRVHAKALGPDAPPPPATPVFPVSPDPREALGTLLALEQQAADSRGAEAVSDPRDGGLLAAIGACEAVHVDLLMAALPSVNAPAPGMVSSPPARASAPMARSSVPPAIVPPPPVAPPPLPTRSPAPLPPPIAAPSVSGAPAPSPTSRGPAR